MRSLRRSMMRKLIEIAKDNDCKEVWLGADAGNSPANAFYRSLGADDISEVIGYTYKTGA